MERRVSPLFQGRSVDGNHDGGLRPRRRGKQHPQAAGQQHQGIPRRLCLQLPVLRHFSVCGSLGPEETILIDGDSLQSPER